MSRNPSASSLQGGSSHFTNLLAAARRGSPDAFGPLFEAARGQLLAMAQQELPQTLRPKLGPSDIVQETAVDAQRDFPQFTGTTAEECFAWLRTVLRNNVIDAIRRYDKSLKRGGVQEVSLATAYGRRQGEGVRLAQSLPEGSAIRREDASSVARMLERLPADYREVLELRYWQGLSFVEIGGRIGRSPDAVRKLWYRALERLQAESTSPPDTSSDGSDANGTGVPAMSTR
jgi:RNA polymerase sigma-70 factor (ECF subfamily)